MKESNKRKCAYCTIVHTVDISDVLDPLFENKIIDDEIIDQKFRGTPAASLWKQLFLQLKISSLPVQELKAIFIDCLHLKYRDIAEAVKAIEFDKIFVCSCKSRNRERMSIASDFQTDGSGSLSDVSSISTMNELVKLHRTLSPSIETNFRDENTLTSHVSLVPRSDDVELFDDEKYAVFCNTPKEKEDLFNPKEKKIQQFVKAEITRRHTVEVTENLGKFHNEENPLEENNTWPRKQSMAKHTSKIEVLKRKLKSIPTLQGGSSKSPGMQKIKGTYTCINSQRYSNLMNTAKGKVIEKERTVQVSQTLHNIRLSSQGNDRNSFEDLQLPPESMLKESEKQPKLSMQRRQRGSPRFNTN